VDNTTKAIIAAGAAVGLWYVISPFMKGKPSRGNGATSAQHKVMLYADIIWREGVANVVEPALIAAVMENESGGDYKALSNKGAIGLMQIMPSTGSWYCGYTENELWDPGTNISCGARYLGFTLGTFRSVPGALAGYNAGPGNVNFTDSGMLDVPSETKNFIIKVLADIPRYRLLFKAKYSNYDIIFPPESWPLQEDLILPRPIEGLGQLTRPRWGYRYNLENQDRNIPGACSWPARGLGIRTGTRWMYQPGR